MELNRLLMVLIFSSFFILVQIIALTGCYNGYRFLKKKKSRIALLLLIFYLNLSYLFLFYRFSLAPQIKLLVNYFLLYPYFIYMLLCLALFPYFLISTLLILLKNISHYIYSNFILGYKKNRATQKPFRQEDRRIFLKTMTASVLSPLAGGAAYGTYLGRNQCSVEKISLVFSDIPEEMDGISIVQISDIHAGVFMEGWELAPYIERVNRLNPDIVVITGDIISWGSYYIEPVVDVLAQIKAVSGVFAIMGNHDFYGDMDVLCANLEKAGITVLRNRWLKIDLRNHQATLYLIGIDDLWAMQYFRGKTISLQDTLQGIPRDAFKILLSHNPKIFNEAAREGVNLTLSGHTHAGQVIFPFPKHHGYSLARLIYSRDYGLFRKDDSCLYINRGLGVIGPPLRINCPQEITWIELKNKNGTIDEA